MKTEFLILLKILMQNSKYNQTNLTAKRRSGKKKGVDKNGKEKRKEKVY